MTRLGNWQSALDRFINEHRSDRFQYGTWDCCLFVCGAIEAMTGTDIAAHFRARYRTRKEALRAIREKTGRASIRAVAEDAAAVHGMPLAASLRRGDMALVRWGARGYLLGLVSLTGRDVLAVSNAGTVRLPLSTVVMGWHV
ncbi:MAG: hypothetical protein JWN34_2011 [Bryobacterales bacterium]|nr:hypothetical protein [Bryobacterales bacterium]